jgi:hypothetical protein
MIERTGGRQRRYEEELMSSFGEREPLIPDDPEFYAPPRVRERATSSLSQEARSEPIRPSPISLPASLQDQDNDAFWNPLAPEVINEPARTARDRLTTQLSLAAAVAGVATVAVLLFLLMKPAPPQSVAGSKSSDITGSMSTALAKPGPGDAGSKPALEEFKALLASPPSQPATQEQSQQLLQGFLQWRKKANTTETSQ